MDNTLLAGIFGLIGSLVGGITSYFGSKKAANQQIKAQIEKENESKRETIIVSSRIIYIDLFTALRETIRLINNVEKPGFGDAPEDISVSKDFSQNIVLLSPVLTFNEMVLLNKLYGHIKKLSEDIFKYDPFVGNQINSRHTASKFAAELFGSNYKGYVTTFDYNEMQEELIIKSMENQYLALFCKLKEASNIQSC